MIKLPQLPELSWDLLLAIVSSSELYIALFGVTAVALSQSVYQSRRKWAGIWGLIGQPFWFHSAYTGEKWGIFTLCFLYTFFWGKGVYINWLKKPQS